MESADKKVILEQIYEMVRRIPPGRVTTYGAIAGALGLKKSARFIGWALGHCPYTDVPAHRVVNHAGCLTARQRFATATEMAERLEAEGVSIANEKVVDFARQFWNPDALADF